MKPPHYLPLVLLPLMGCGSPDPNEASTVPSLPLVDTVSTVPARAPSALPERYAHHWTRPALDRWETYWLEQYPADSTGDLRERRVDLDGDGRTDQALFLTRTDTTRRDSTYALVILLASGRDTLLASYEWAEFQGGIGLGLTCEPPGELMHLGGEGDEEDAPTSTRITSWAITMEFFEKAAITWFWKDGRFHQVWTGD